MQESLIYVGIALASDSSALKKMWPTTLLLLIPTCTEFFTRRCVGGGLKATPAI